MPSHSWWKDAVERVVWTAIQSGIGVAIIMVSELDILWAPAFMAVLAAIKATVAKKIGDPESAATLTDQ